MHGGWFWKYARPWKASILLALKIYDAAVRIKGVCSAWADVRPSSQCFSLNKYILKFRQIYLTIWTNTLEPTSAHQVKTLLLTNIFLNSHKYILQFVQICLSRRLPIKSRLFHWTNIFQNSDKYILQFWEIAWADVCPVSFSLSNFGSSFRDCRGQAW